MPPSHAFQEPYKLPQGPYKLVSVNTAPERARKLIGRIVEDVRDKYTIIHSANADSIESVALLVSEHKPDLLFCASMWTPAQSDSIQSIARDIVPGIRTFAVPQGMQVEKGPDAVVEFVEGNLDEIINGDLGLNMADTGA